MKTNSKMIDTTHTHHDSNNLLLFFVSVIMNVFAFVIENIFTNIYQWHIPDIVMQLIQVAAWGTTIYLGVKQYLKQRRKNG